MRELQRSYEFFFLQKEKHLKSVKVSVIFDGDCSDPARHRAPSSVGTCPTFSWQTALRCDISTLSYPNSPFQPFR